MDPSEDLDFMPERSHAKTNKPPTAAHMDALDKSFQEASTGLAVIMAEEEALKPNQIVSKEALQARYQKELQDEFTDYRKRLENGAAKLIGSLTELAKENPELFSQDVLDEIESIIALSEEMETDEGKLGEELANGTSLQELAHISDATIDKLYQGARRLYTLNNFTDAADAFKFLTSLNAKNSAFWLGLGNSEYSSGRYKEALYAFTYASQTNPTDPNCHVMSCRCYEALGEIENALNALDLVLFAIANQPEYADWTPWITSEKKRLNTLVK